MSPGANYRLFEAQDGVTHCRKGMCVLGPGPEGAAQ
jgi:hypothetical protein